MADFFLVQAPHFVRAVRWGVPDTQKLFDKLSESEGGDESLFAAADKGEFSPLTLKAFVENAGTPLHVWDPEREEILNPGDAKWRSQWTKQFVYWAQKWGFKYSVKEESKEELKEKKKKKKEKTGNDGE